MLLIHNINPTAEKSSKNWFKMTHETSRSGRSSLSYCILNFAKKCQKDTDSTLLSVLAHFPQKKYQPRFIQSLRFQGHFRSVLWALSNGYNQFVKLSENIFKNFVFSEIPLYEAALLASEQKQKIFEVSPSRILIFMFVSFICTNFEAFTTFRTIFTRIRRTIHSSQTWCAFLLSTSH